MSLQDAIYEVAAAMREVSGVKDAPNEPPESTDNFPFISTTPGTGSYVHEAGVKKGMHDINVDLYVERKDSPLDFRRATPFIDRIVNKIFTKQKNGTWTSFSTFADVDYEFTTFLWADQPLLGYRIVLRDVKIQEAV
jgi:hypothetical protein